MATTVGPVLNSRIRPSGRRILKSNCDSTGWVPLSKGGIQSSTRPTLHERPVYPRRSVRLSHTGRLCRSHVTGRVAAVVAGEYVRFGAVGVRDHRDEAAAAGCA